MEKLDGQLESAMERVDENERTKRVLAHAKTKSVAVQRRLVRIADENKKMTSSIVADKGKYSASEVRIRLNTSQELVRRYMQTTQLIEKVEEMQKERETSAILGELPVPGQTFVTDRGGTPPQSYSSGPYSPWISVCCTGELHTLNPHATESELERAMEQNDFSRVLLVDQLDGRKADIARRVEDLTSVRILYPQDRLITAHVVEFIRHPYAVVSPPSPAARVFFVSSLQCPTLALNPSFLLSYPPQRNAELKALETDMLELNQIHIDMSILVQNQGELFKQLEFNTAEVITQPPPQQGKRTRRDRDIFRERNKDSEGSVRTGSHVSHSCSLSVRGV